MPLLLDSAKIEDAQTAAQLGWVWGITTNPTLLAQSGLTPAETLKKLLEIFGDDKEIFYQLTGKTIDDMRREAEKAREILPWNLVLKIPANDLGFRFTAQFSQYYPIAVTAVYTTAQGLVAQACGARYALFYYGRTNRFLGEGRGLQLARELVQIAKGSEMEIAAASMKTPQEVSEVALAGVPYLSAPLAVLQALTGHELSDQAVQEFDEKGSGLPTN